MSSFYHNGELVERAVVARDFDVTGAQGFAIDQIEQTASSVRHSHVTRDKDATYLNKSSQVDAYIASDYPSNLTGYGYIVAEIEHLGLNGALYADRVAASKNITDTRDAWLMLDGLIEQAALGGKRAVREATTEQAIDAARAAAIAQLEVYRA